MFTQAITPALKSHMEVQMSFFTDLTKKMFDTAQRFSELNLQLAQELLEDATSTQHQLMQAKDLTELASAAAAQAHPATEKMRNYQQRLGNLVANANAELTRSAESHMPDASRTAAAVADELVRRASEETEKATQRQREAIERMNESARRGIDGMAQSLQANQARTQGQTPQPQHH